MKLPRNLNGIDLAQTLCRKWDYTIVHQSGSHIILDTDKPGAHRVSVPAHKPLRIGTLNSILRAVSEHKGCSRQAIIDTL